MFDKIPEEKGEDVYAKWTLVKDYVQVQLHVRVEKNKFIPMEEIPDSLIEGLKDVE